MSGASRDSSPSATRRTVFVLLFSALVVVPAITAAPEPEKGAIGIRIRAPRSAKSSVSTFGMAALIKVRAGKVCFVRLDPSLEAYAVDGVIWPNYSWRETEYLLRNSTETQWASRSGRGNVYLLDADPGRYIALGAWMYDNAGTWSGGTRRPYVAAFSDQLQAETEVRVRPGEMVFIGEFLVRLGQSMAGSQSEFFFRNSDTLFNSGAKVAVADLTRVERDTSIREEFWLDTEKVFEQEPSPMSMNRRSVQTPSLGLHSALLGQDALEDFLNANYEGAVDTAMKAVKAAESEFGSEHPRVAALLSNVAQLHRFMNAHERAQPLYERALEIREKALGVEHPAVAHSLLSLAQLHTMAGIGPTLFAGRGNWNVKNATALAERALAIWEKALGPQHPDVGFALDALAICHMEGGDSQRAVPLLERAVEILKTYFGSEHRIPRTMSTNLALAYAASGVDESAVPLLEKVIAEHESDPFPFPSDTHRLGLAHFNLGLLYKNAGEYERAELELRRAQLIWEELWGNDHVFLSDLLVTLAQIRQHLAASPDEVLALLARAEEIRERDLRRVLDTGSEDMKLDYVAKVGAHQINVALTYHASLGGGNAASARRTLSTVVRWKGRVIDTTAESIKSLRKKLEPEDQAALDELVQLHRQLASLPPRRRDDESIAVGDAYRAQAEARLMELEAQLSERSARFRARRQAVTIERIQQFIPPDAVLVEFIRHHPVSLEGTYGTPRFSAFVLSSTGDPRWVDLGESARIGQLVADFRRVVSRPDLREFRPAAKAIYEAVVRPILPLLGGANHLLLSPDGVLHLVPFEAFVDAQGKFLVETYLLSYLTSGRELTRFAHSVRARDEACVIGDPDFDFAVDESPAGGSASRPVEMAGMTFSRLPSTAVEARMIQALLPNSTLRVGAEASETALRQLEGPEILHIATHGFFLQDLAPALVDMRDARGLTAAATTDLELKEIQTVKNPLLRSGLALAGFNQESSGEDDGVMTALEMSNLDLLGTKLAVLSACQTGMGDIRVGEGVFGLRRALVLAGAESQLMSLWNVADVATQDLMVAYYGRLADGEGRAEALRNVQLEMLAGSDYGHPFYWASFIQSGSWVPLDGRHAPKERRASPSDSSASGKAAHDRASKEEVPVSSEKFATPSEPVRSINDWRVDMISASFDGDAEEVQRALKAGVSGNVRVRGVTPLIAAALKGHADIVAILLDRGVEADTRCSQPACNGSVTALGLASYSGHVEAVKVLLAGGADVNATYGDFEFGIVEGITALRDAVAEGHMAVVSLLLEHGADVNAAPEGGNSPLMRAAAKGRADIVQALLGQPRIDVNYKGPTGSTALMAAASYGHPETVRMLLDHPGIDVNSRDAKGKTAMDRAKGKSVKELLRQAGSKRSRDL